MGNFAEFYQQGGFFMHVVSALALVAASVLVRRLIRLAKGSHFAGAGAVADFTGTVLLLATMTGVLGTAFGLIEMCAALRTIPLDAWPSALSRAFAIALTTVAWGLMVAIPLGLVHGVTRYAERRRG